MLYTPANCMKPNRNATCITRQIILAKISAENYADYAGWHGINARSKRLHDTFAKEAIKQETRLSEAFRLTGNSVCNDFYIKDGHGRLYHTEQDEVTEATTEQELKDRLSSCITYSEDFMRELRVKRALNFK